MATKTLLVAVDLGKASASVVSQAAALARSLSAKIVLLHVVEPKAAAVLPAGKAKRGPMAAAWPLRTPKSQAHVEERLNAIAEPLKTAAIEVKTSVVAGLLADEILDQSVECRADYIVLGSRGKATQHLVTRQDALTGMLRRLKCPLIIVPVTTASE